MDIPFTNAENETLWDAFLRMNFPEVWEKKYGRALFLPGEPFGVQGPTTSGEAGLWHQWLVKYKRRE